MTVFLSADTECDGTNVWIQEQYACRPLPVLPEGNVVCFNPLEPHDALKHHLAFRKKMLDFLQLVVLERQFSWNSLKITLYFFHLSPIVSHPHSL